MVTLTQLEYIVAVDRLRHFGKAAKACHVSQPSLSMQIQKAEDHFGMAIFDRLKKPVIPTEQGVPIIAQAKVVLREHARLMQIGNEAAKEPSGEFRLGIIPTIAPYLLPLFLEKFAKNHPRVRLHVDELKTAEIIQALRGDELDGGILATPLEEEGLRERVLYYEPFYLYLHGRHPLTERARVREADLDANQMWLLSDGHCFREQVVRYCHLETGDHSVLSNVRFEGSNFETLRYLIRKGGGYTLLPHLFVANLSEGERSAAVRSFEGPIPTREVSLVSRRDEWKSLVTDALESTIRSSLPRDLLERRNKRLEVLEPR